MFSATVSQAASLSGVVVRDERVGALLGNVKVAASGATTTWTAISDGSFVLDFPYRRAGETVELHVSYPGLVVVNATELTLRLPAQNEPPTIILMATPAQRKDLAIQYYRIRGVEAAEKHRQRLLKAIADQAASDSLQFARIDAEIAEWKAQVEQAAILLAEQRVGEAAQAIAGDARAFLAGELSGQALVDRIRPVVDAILAERPLRVRMWLEGEAALIGSQWMGEYRSGIGIAGQLAVNQRLGIRATALIAPGGRVSSSSLNLAGPVNVSDEVRSHAITAAMALQTLRRGANDVAIEVGLESRREVWDRSLEYQDTIRGNRSEQFTHRFVEPYLGMKMSHYTSTPGVIRVGVRWTPELNETLLTNWTFGVSAGMGLGMVKYDRAPR